MSLAELETFFKTESLPQKLILRYGVCTNVRGAAEGLIRKIKGSTNQELSGINMLHLVELKNAIDNYNEDDYINDPLNYCIKDQPELKDCLHIQYTEYVMLRELLKNKLLTFFKEVSYKDAGINTAFIYFSGVIFSANKYWPYSTYNAMNVFYVPKWLCYMREGLLDREFNNQLKIIEYQYHHTLKKESSS